jgi:AraC-like DNA-binding protein
MMSEKGTFRYQKYLPAPALSSHISWFYTLEYTANGAVMNLPALANPACALVINYGDRYHLSNMHYRQEQLPAHFFSGISTGPYHIQLSGTVKSVGVIFKSSIFRDVFGLPSLEELSDRRADASLFSTVPIHDLADQLAELSTDYEKIVLINRFFMQAFGSRLHTTDVADRIAGTILNVRGRIAMDELAARHYMSGRHLRRIFGDRYGISPKMYARIKRFGYTYYSIQQGQHSWRNSLDENGYYDQAHLIKEFQAFSGTTPRALLQAWRQVQQTMTDA